MLPALGLIMLVAALLGFYRLGAKSLLVDEACTWIIARDWTQLLSILPDHEANMWLYYGMIHFWMRLFGESEFALRSFSALAGLATIPAVFWVANRLFGGRAGLTAALLLAVNPFFLTAAQDARGYALTVLLVTVSTGLLLKAVERKRLIGWVWYTLATALSVYTHYFAALVILAHGVYLLTLPAPERPRLPALVFSAGLGFILLAPIPLLQPLGSGQVDWIAKPRIGELVLIFQRMAGGTIGLIAALTTTALGTGWAIANREGPRSSHGNKHPWGLPAAWLLVPILTAFLFSRFATPVWVPRYLIVALPAFAILLGGAIAQLGCRPWLPLFVLSGLVFTQAAGLPAVYREEKQDWKNAVRWMADHAQPGDGVWLAPPAYSYMAARYYPAAPPIVHLPNERKKVNPASESGSLNEKKPPRTGGITEKEARRISRQYQRIWIVAVPRGGHDRWTELTKAIKPLESRYPVKEKHDFTGIRVVLLTQ